jgi:hypothetical protein
MTIEDEAAPTGGSERHGFNGGRIHKHFTRPCRVYLAAPLSARDDPEYYPTCRNLVTSAWPEAELVEGIRAFLGSMDWQRRFNMVLRSCDCLVFVARPDGSIGAGVVREVVEAVFWRLPVSLATSDRLIPVEEVSFRFLADGSPDRFASVEVGS